MSYTENRRTAAPDRAVPETLLMVLVAEAYDRCHPGDSFEELGRRARFSKEDRRLMEDWTAAVRRGA